MISLQSQSELINDSTEHIQFLNDMIRKTFNQDAKFKFEMHLRSEERRLIKLLLECRTIGMEVSLIDVTDQEIWEDK